MRARAKVQCCVGGPRPRACDLREAYGRRRVDDVMRLRAADTLIMLGDISLETGTSLHTYPYTYTKL